MYVNNHFHKRDALFSTVSYLAKLTCCSGHLIVALVV